MSPETSEGFNESNVSPNAYCHILRFLEGQSEEWTPSTLAKELDMSPGTVRWAFWKLRKQVKVIYRKVGKYHFYAANKRFRNDSPTECVSVQGFSQWFARVYDKKLFVREEIHSREEKSLEEFIALVDGSLTSVQVMNFLDVLSRNINSLQASNFELARRVAQLADKVNSLLSINS